MNSSQLSNVTCALAEKSEAEAKICQLQTLWETEKAKEAEKLSDLEKARELLLNSKVELQRRLDECQSDLQRLHHSQKEAEEEKQNLMRSHSKTIADLNARQVIQLPHSGQ